MPAMKRHPASQLDPKKLVSQLDVEAIRSRIGELDGERSALLVLLRAALARGRHCPYQSGRRKVVGDE
jgi:hypothetical protein